LSHHFAGAELVLGPNKLVRYSLQAGERALMPHAYEDAIPHFERALVARGISLSGTETASDEEAAALLFGLARAKSAITSQYQILQVFANLSRAFEYYAEAGNVPLAVAVAEFPIAAPSYLIPGDIELMTRALSLVPPDSHEAGRLLSRYGEIIGSTESDYEGAQQALGRAIAIARRDGDTSLEARSLTYAASVSGQHLRLQESVDYGMRAIELTNDGTHTWSELTSRFWTAHSLLSLGNLDAARPYALILRDLNERGISPASHVVPITYLACLVGDWEAARRYCDSGSQMGPHHLFSRVLLEYETGETSQGEVYFESLADVMRRPGPGRSIAAVRVAMAIPAIAWITGVPGNWEMAEAAAESVLSERNVIPFNALYAKTGLALLAIQKGNQSAAAEQYAYLLEQRSRMVMTVSSVDRLLGLVSNTMNNQDRAETHFNDALGFCRKAGYRPELAWTCRDYAAFLLQLGGMGERERAATLLDEGLIIADELGMAPLMNHVAALQEQIGSESTSGSPHPDGLTAREVEVLRQIALGKTNREVADELVISLNTVARHLGNIFNKTDVTNRTQATNYAIRHGLV